MKKKKIRTILLASLLAYLLWLGFQLVTFESYTTAPIRDSSYEVTGVFHIHSTFSDGRRSIEEIAGYASAQSLDFAVITDHGSPNHESLRSEGWTKGVLVLCGSELSENRGHLVAVGFKIPSSSFSHKAEEAVHQINALGGFTVIAHPYSKVQWSWGPAADYGGIEIISADSMLRQSLPLSLLYIPALAINPKFAFLKVLERPEKNLLKWDSLNESQHIYGYYSTDAHLLYRALFAALHLHIPLSKPLSREFECAKKQVLQSLRRGNFYSAVDGAAGARGFRFWAEQEGNVIPMGSVAPAGSKTSFYATMPVGVAFEARLLRDGDPVFQSQDQTWTYAVSESAGTYRVEVYLREKTPIKKDIPWILSNPIFLKERTDD
ncbi:MAG: CehA/McbA family metallohydrolase [Candidatus Aminicenantes bacterium]|jgi:hypothetical protein